MKKEILLVWFLFGMKSSFFAQEKATDLFNVNVNFIGVGIQYEKALSNSVTALGIVDYMGGLSYSDDGYDSNFDYIFTTKLSVEGRYYYNFDRRIQKGRTTINNSANYIALKMNYIPDWLTSSSDNKKIEPQGSATFNYGLKRAFAKNFFYEFYTGLGFSLYTKHEYTFTTKGIQKNTDTTVGAAFDLGLRLGYNF